MMQIEGARAARGTTRRVTAQPAKTPARNKNRNLPVSAQRTVKYRATTIAKSVVASDIII